MKKHRKTDKRAEIQRQFPLTGGLTRVKLIEYLPALIATNISTLLLVSVDGLVVGNLRGAEAFASVSLTAPAEFFISSLSILIASGSAMSLSTALGRNDQKGVLSIKKTIFLTTILAALICTLAQIPVVYAMVHSLDLDPDVESMAWDYAIGLMIAAPFGLISSVAVYQLESTGKMKVLVWLSVMEGIVNLLLDLLFVGVLDMGVGGAGLGTAGASLLRCGATIAYLYRRTDLLRWGTARARRKDAVDILRYGLPDMANMAMLTLREYLLVAIIVGRMSTDGGVIYGVAGFCFSLANLFISGVQGSARPLLGLMIGAKDWAGLRILMRQCILLMAVLVMAATLLFEAAPGLVFRLYGQTEIPEGGLMALRLDCLFFVFYGSNTLLRMYFANRKDTVFTTIITVVSNISQPTFAFVLSLLFPPVWIWLCFLLAELLILPLNLRRYGQWMKRDETEDLDGHVISISVKPENAAEVSRQIREFAEENGIPERIAFRAALCMEDMVAYATESQSDLLNMNELQIQIIVWFRKNEARFLMIDNGECLELEAVDADSDVWKLLENKYYIAEKIASSISYQYLLELNYSMFVFEE